MKQIKKPATRAEFDALFGAIQQSNMTAAQKKTILQLLKSSDEYIFVDMLHLDEIPDIGDELKF